MFGPVVLDMGIPLFGYSWSKIVEARKNIFLISQYCVHPILYPILLDMIG